MEKTIIDDVCGKVIDKRAEKLDPEKYPKIISVLGGNDEIKDCIGYTSTNRPIYSVCYVWQTICAPSDLDALEERLNK